MSKGQKLKLVLSHILVVVWMIVIFCFSAQPGEKSADLSGSISYLFMQVWNWMFRLGWNEAEILEMTAIWDFPIRKLAHMTEFGILAVLLFGAIKYYTQINTMKKRYLCAWLAAVVYAASDEFHQLFVPDRSGNLFDICVDAFGVSVALVFLYLLRRIYGRIRQF